MCSCSRQVNQRVKETKSGRFDLKAFLEMFGGELDPLTVGLVVVFVLGLGSAAEEGSGHEAQDHERREALHTCKSGK